MNLSIDAHKAVAAVVLPQAKISDGAASDQATSDMANASTMSTSAAPAAAYTISTSAVSTGSVGAASQPLSGIQDDLTGDGARLMALQVTQAISNYSGSLANPSSQAILSLFRN